MENYVMYLLILANYIMMFGYHGSEGYTFKIRYYDTLNVVEPQYELSWKEYFPNLDVEERHSLCRQATEIAELDTVKDPPAHRVMNYFMRNGELIHLIRCRTVPLAYLHYGDTKTKKDLIIIAMERNKFAGNHFDVTIIKSAPIHCSKTLENDPLYFEVDPKEFKNVVETVCENDSMLRISHMRRHWRNQDRIHLCMAAREVLKNAEPRYGPLPVFRSDYLDNAEIYYEEKQNDAEKEKHYALRCLSLPEMYLYYQNLRISTALKILLVASNTNNDE